MAEVSMDSMLEIIVQFQCRTPVASRDEARIFSLLNAVFVVGKVGRRVQTFNLHTPTNARVCVI